MERWRVRQIGSITSYKPLLPEVAQYRKQLSVAEPALFRYLLVNTEYMLPINQIGRSSIVRHSRAVRQ